MLCLEFSIPPLPQFVTVGHAVWAPGDQHFARAFGVYDLLLVKRGTLYMKEEEKKYAVGPGKLLVLEAGFKHAGYRPCEEPTEVYWVHFVHGIPAAKLNKEDIPWSALQTKGTVDDLLPAAHQRLYMPKFASVDVGRIEPILDEMNGTHSRLNAGNALQLHVQLAELFMALQRECASALTTEPSLQVARAAAAYLEACWREPYRSSAMEEKLHFQGDYITRCMKRHIGTTPLQYVLHLRLEEAKKLLGGTVLGIADIAERTGMKDANYMARWFKAKTGLSPGAYRRLRQGKGHPD